MRGLAAVGFLRVTARALGALVVALLCFPNGAVAQEATPTPVALSDESRVALAAEIASALAGVRVSVDGTVVVSSVPSVAVSSMPSMSLDGTASVSLSDTLTVDPWGGRDFMPGLLAMGLVVGLAVGSVVLLRAVRP